MKLFTCQKYFILELWQQLPWVLLEQDRMCFVLAAPPGCLQELLLLGFFFWLGASGKWVQMLSLPCFCHHILPEKGFWQAVKIHLVQCQVLVSGLRGEA